MELCMHTVLVLAWCTSTVILYVLKGGCTSICLCLLASTYGILLSTYTILNVVCPYSSLTKDSSAGMSTRNKNTGFKLPSGFCVRSLLLIAWACLRPWLLLSNSVGNCVCLKICSWLEFLFFMPSEACLLLSLATQSFSCGFAGYLINIVLSLLVTSASKLCQFLAFHFPAVACVLLLVLFSKKGRLTLFSTNVDFWSLHELLYLCWLMSHSSLWALPRDWFCSCEFIFVLLWPWCFHHQRMWGCQQGLTPSLFLYRYVTALRQAYACLASQLYTRNPTTL